MDDKTVVFSKLVGGGTLNGAIIKTTLDPNGKPLKQVVSPIAEGDIGGTVTEETVSDEELRELELID